MAEQDNPKLKISIFHHQSSILSSPKLKDGPKADNFHSIITNTNMIQMIQAKQFHGTLHEDPTLHVRNFLKLSDTFKNNEVTSDANRLTLFPFSLAGQAADWLNNLPNKSVVTSWEVLKELFFEKFFPPLKTIQLRNDILNFKQQPEEALYETWGRFKKLLLKCPHHQIPEWLQLQSFFNGLSRMDKRNLNIAANGNLMIKRPCEAFEIIEDVISEAQQWIDSNEDVMTKLTALRKEVSLMRIMQEEFSSFQPVLAVCTFCCKNHNHFECPQIVVEDATYVDNQNRQQDSPFSNTYNSSWKNHPNFSWSNQRKTYCSNDLFCQFMQTNEARLKAIENQISQLNVALHNMSQGAVSSNMHSSQGFDEQKEHSFAITVGSENDLQGVSPTIVKKDQHCI